MSHPFSRNSIIALFLILLPLFLYQSALAAEIRLAWNPNSENDLARYKVYYGTSGRTGTDPNSCGLCGYSTSVNVGNVTTYTITGLTLGQTYFISVTAFNASGESSYSNEVWGAANDPPITPETVNAPGVLSGPTTGTTGTFYRYTTGGSSSNLGHSVEYQFDWGDGTNSGWLRVGQSSASKSWTSYGTYNVRAKARCSIHTSILSPWTEPLSVTIFSPPSPPTNVQASGGTFTDKVQVTWTASPEATSYTVYRATSTSSWATKKALGTTSGTTYDDTTASVMVNYYYYVKASNLYGTSAYSTYNKGYRSDGRPPAPTNLEASDGTYMDKVQVTWTASPEADSYTVYRATSTSSRATKVAIGTTSYTTYDDTTASVGKTYYYWVKASNLYGTSGYSAYNTGYRSDGRPPPPTNVSASDGNYVDKVQVTWTASPNADLYTVYRATSTSSWVTKTALGSTPSTTFDDTTASVGKTYYYWVKASNSYGTSGFSAYDKGNR